LLFAASGSGAPWKSKREQSAVSTESLANGTAKAGHDSQRAHLRVALLAAALLAVAHRLVLGAARLELVGDGLLASLGKGASVVSGAARCRARSAVPLTFSDLVLWMFSISTRLFLKTLPFT
jgi:hypothetical protein